MSAPTNLRYLPTHEWHRLEGDTVTVGISQHAADELTDITYVELPPVGQKLQAGKRMGEIESVKATADLYSGVSGTVTEVNLGLNDDPSPVNNDPFNEGWMVKIKADDPSELEKLLSAEQYAQSIGG